MAEQSEPGGAGPWTGAEGTIYRFGSGDGF